jgi:hypothetical protein
MRKGFDPPGQLTTTYKIRDTAEEARVYKIENILYYIILFIIS